MQCTLTRHHKEELLGKKPCHPLSKNSLPNSAQGCWTNGNELHYSQNFTSDITFHYKPMLQCSKMCEKCRILKRMESYLKLSDKDTRCLWQRIRKTSQRTVDVWRHPEPRGISLQKFCHALITILESYMPC